jgi:2-phospho-L-lactate guanylyltransferase
MNRWLLAPVKPLAEAKSRLAPVLTEQARAALMRDLLNHTLALAVQSRLFVQLLVISRDPTVWEIAHSSGAAALAEKGNDLNSALHQGRAYAQRRGAGSLLIIPADLPLLTITDLQALCSLASVGDGVVVSPSQDGGTNALHLRLPSSLPFRFGEDSFALHLAAARAAGLAPVTYDSPTLRMDLDWPTDLAALPSVLQRSLEHF